jgi:HlyD family secretion protein
VIAVIFSLAFTRKDQLQYFTAKVERGSVRDVVDATGTINAVTTVLVGSQISGRIAKLSADFNSVVRKGQVIAEIDPALFEGALLQAVADLKSAQVNVLAARANLDKAKSLHLQAKADYERAATLSKQDSIAMQAVDLAKATYDAAAATVEASVAAVQQAEAQVSQKEGAVAVARTNLEYTVIRSPINGTVVARNVDVGQTVAASLQAPTLFTIAQDLTKMQVYAKTDETNVGKVRAGRPVTFKVDAFPKDTFKGVVSQVRMNPVTVQNVVNYDAIIDFDNPELKLFPGMTAYVTIPVASAENVLKIPNGALRYTPRLSKAALEELQANPGIEAESEIVVWKLRPDNSVDPVRLALGITDHSYTVVAKVLSGDLREGDDLITGAVPSKRDSGAPPAGGPPRK